jgi:parallel beta-helix repeat protein
MQSPSRFIAPVLLPVLLAFVAAAPGCSDDDKSGGSPDGGSSTGGKTSSEAGSTGGKGTGGKASAGDASGCDVVLAPSDDDTQTIQSALDNDVKTGNTVCFGPGTYKLTDHIALSGSQNVTFRGTGATRDDVLFDFSGQTNGKEGVLVTTDHFTIENLSVKNTGGNGIQVQANDSTFRNIKVGWDRSVGDAGTPVSGGYAIYPTGCVNTLIVDSEVYGASDAGVYAGQCEHVIAHGNDSHGNVLGIEIENTTDADIYDNEVHDNTTGFLLDLLPNLTKKTSTGYLVHDNHVYGNNRPNFAVKGSTAASAASGTGILVLAAKDIEITGNEIEGNDSAPVFIVSYDIIALIGGGGEKADPETNRYPARIYVHDNTYSKNGGAPKDSSALLATGPDGGTKTIDSLVLWDGILDADAKATEASTKICVSGPEAKGFLNFHADASLLDPSGWTTDITDHQCTLTVPPLTP